MNRPARGKTLLPPQTTTFQSNSKTSTYTPLDHNSKGQDYSYTFCYIESRQITASSISRRASNRLLHYDTTAIERRGLCPLHIHTHASEQEERNKRRETRSIRSRFYLYTSTTSSRNKHEVTMLGSGEHHAQLAIMLAGEEKRATGALQRYISSGYR